MPKPHSSSRLLKIQKNYIAELDKTYWYESFLKRVAISFLYSYSFLCVWYSSYWSSNPPSRPRTWGPHSRPSQGWSRTCRTPCARGHWCGHQKPFPGWARSCHQSPFDECQHCCQYCCQYCGVNIFDGFIKHETVRTCWRNWNDVFLIGLMSYIKCITEILISIN